MALTDNILSYWKLDSNSSDSAASNNGTDASISYANAGIISNCATFNGTSSSIDLNTSAAFNITGDKTFSFWINTTVKTGTPVIIGKFNGSGNNWYFAVNASWQIIFNTNWWIDLLATWATDITTLWRCHVVWVVSWSSKQIYLNWSTNGSSASFSSCSPSGNMFFGKFWSLTSNYYNGKLDEVGIWNRALSWAEISSLYNSWSGFTYPFSW
jgi:hypothetical protein